MTHHEHQLFLRGVLFDPKMALIGQCVCDKFNVSSNNRSSPPPFTYGHSIQTIQNRSFQVQIGPSLYQKIYIDQTVRIINQNLSRKLICTTMDGTRRPNTVLPYFPCRVSSLWNNDRSQPILYHLKSLMAYQDHLVNTVRLISKHTNRKLLLSSCCQLGRLAEYSGRLSEPSTPKKGILWKTR